jgi:hypothetical protein
MSREIDLSKPLSDADRNYLEQRSRFAELQYADSVHSGEKLTDEQLMELEQKAIEEAKGKRVPLQMDPDAVRTENDDDDEDAGEQAPAEEGDDPDDVAYVSRATVNDLKEQLANRELPTSGNKPELQRRMLDALKAESQQANQ